MDYKALYALWIKDWGEDAELAALDEAELKDRFYTRLDFGTAGMRGVLGAGANRMNAQNVMLATQGLAQYISETPGGARRGVAIAYDSRRCSAEFALIAARVLAGNGVNVYLYDELRPVPVLSFTLRELGCVAGIVVTASHNPPEYNGYKVYWEDGGQMPPERADAVLKLIRAQSAATVRMAETGDEHIHIIGAEMDDQYIARVKALCMDPEATARLGGEFRVVYTPLNGSGNKPVRRILREIGFSNVWVVKEQELPDPDFTTVGTPNPENPGVYKLAIELADREGADLIFGTDPDCDRLGVAVRDGEGRFTVLTGNQIGCLLEYFLLQSMKDLGRLPANGAVVKSVVSTEMARAIADAFGVATIDVMTGFKFIAEQIQLFEDTGAHTFLFGFEESYGYLTGTFVRDKDAVIASMLLCQAAAWYRERGLSLQGALGMLQKRFGYYVEEVVSFTFTGEDGLNKMDALMKRLRAEPPEGIGGVRVTRARDYLTGQNAGGIPPSNALYYELEGGAWVCVRPSGTEPKVKLYVNAVAQSETEARRMLADLKSGAQALM